MVAILVGNNKLITTTFEKTTRRSSSSSVSGSTNTDACDRNFAQNVHVVHAIVHIITDTYLTELLYQRRYYLH